MSEALLSPQPNRARRLRERLAQGPLAVPGAFNAITAKIVEDLGFDAVYISGAGLHNGVAGYPDIGLLTLNEMSQFSGYIARSVSIPAIADADTGFGEAMNVFRTVQLYEQEGVAGIHLEDQVSPKRCGHLGGKQVISETEMAEKVAAAVAARQNPDFLIIARVDSKAVYGFEDAVKRANLYLEAGADMIFPEALETPEEFATFAKQVSGPLLANMTEFGKSPYLPLSDFEQMGYQIVIYPMTAFRVMMKAVRDALSQLKAEGTQAGFLDQMTTRKDLYSLIHYDAYTAMDTGLVHQVP